MNVLILYYSKTGNTKKLAEAVMEGVNRIEGVEAILRDTETVTRDDFREASGIIVGSPVYVGTMAWPVKKILDEFIDLRKEMEGKVGAAFATSGAQNGGKETTMFSIIQGLLIYGMIIAGDPMSATGHYGSASVGAPTADDRENAAQHGERVARLVKKL